jgi:hypothetical protein
VIEKWRRNPFLFLGLFPFFFHPFFRCLVCVNAQTLVIQRGYITSLYNFVFLRNIVEIEENINVSTSLPEIKPLSWHSQWLFTSYTAVIILHIRKWSMCALYGWKFCLQKSLKWNHWTVFLCNWWKAPHSMQLHGTVWYSDVFTLSFTISTHSALLFYKNLPEKKKNFATVSNR